MESTEPTKPVPLPTIDLFNFIILSVFDAFAAGLIPFELIQLDEQIVHVLQMLDLVNLFEFINESQPTDIEDINLHLQLIVEEIYGLASVVIPIEDGEVDIAEVYHKEIEDFLIVFGKVLDKLLLFLLLKVALLGLALLKLLVKVVWQILHFLDLSSHLHLHHHQLLLSYLEGSVAVEILETLRNFTMLHIVENIHLVNQFFHLHCCLGEEGLGGQLPQLLILYFADEDVLLHIDESLLEVI